MAKAKETVKDLWIARAGLVAEKEHIEADIKEIDSKLFAMIPRGEKIDGVKHQYSDTNSVSYAKYLQAVIDEYVPKTKQAAAKALVSEFTTVSHREFVQAAKE